jgi:hypothetical protein
MKRYFGWMVFVSAIAIAIKLKGWSRYQDRAFIELTMVFVVGLIIGLCLAVFTDRSRGMAAAFLKLGSATLCGLILGAAATSADLGIRQNIERLALFTFLGLMLGLMRFFATKRSHGSTRAP